MRWKKKAEKITQKDVETLEELVGWDFENAPIESVGQMHVFNKRNWKFFETEQAIAVLKIGNHPYVDAPFFSEAKDEVVGEEDKK